MNYKIIADSSCDLSEELKNKLTIELVPLTLNLEDRTYVDDESLNVAEYVNDMNHCRTAPKTSCPSPNDFMKRYEGSEESVFVVTLSSKLSGTYNSAVLAKNMFLENVNNKFIHVFDSLSASVGETLICIKINELAKLNLKENEIVERVTKFIKEMKTFFLLESLEHLAKAGRLNPIVAKIASILSIKPIMGADEQGNIKLFDKINGYKRAFNKLVDIIGIEGTNLEDKILGIAHCNCIERAMEFKEQVMKRYKFKDIFIVNMAGLTSTYADDKGLVIAF